MFIGHFAVAFGAKRIVPAVSLGTMLLAAQLADLLWPNFVLAGLEQFEVRPGATVVTPLEFVSYPYSHSLLALTLWAALAALLYRRIGRPWKAALAVAAAIVSHWVLDAVTHKPDMPLAFGSYRVGFSLWNSVPGTVGIECVMLLAGLVLYARTTEPRDRVGQIALWSLVAFLLVVYLASVFAPPPLTTTAVTWSVQAIWLIVAWGYWVDRHRVLRAR